MVANENWYFTKEQLEDSPSRRWGFDSDKELFYRQKAANFIQDIGQKLMVSQLCINTAIVYMHRFYMTHPFTLFPWDAMATASIFLATKTEEQPRKKENVIRISKNYSHMDQSKFDANSEQFVAQSEDLLTNENILLQTLGFDLVINHPHAHVVRCCYLIHAPKDIAETSYFIASNSLHLTTMCLQYKPTVVACFCVHLACKWSKWQIPKLIDNKDWFHHIDRSVTSELLEQLTAEFLEVYDRSPSKLKTKITVVRQKHSNLDLTHASGSNLPFDPTASSSKANAVLPSNKLHHTPDMDESHGKRDWVCERERYTAQLAVQSHHEFKPGLEDGTTRQLDPVVSTQDHEYPEKKEEEGLKHEETEAVELSAVIHDAVPSSKKLLHTERREWNGERNRFLSQLTKRSHHDSKPSSGDQTKRQYDPYVSTLEREYHEEKRDKLQSKKAATKAAAAVRLSRPPHHEPLVPTAPPSTPNAVPSSSKLNYTSDMANGRGEKDRDHKREKCAQQHKLNDKVRSHHVLKSDSGDKAKRQHDPIISTLEREYHNEKKDKLQSKKAATKVAAAVRLSRPPHHEPPLTTTPPSTADAVPSSTKLRHTSTMANGRGEKDRDQKREKCAQQHKLNDKVRSHHESISNSGDKTTRYHDPDPISWTTEREYYKEKEKIKRERKRVAAPARVVKLSRH